MTEITTKEYIDDKIKLHDLYVIGDILNRMSETIKIATDELEDDFRENDDKLDNRSIDSILNMMEFNVDKINDYLGELRSSILK